LAWLDYGTRFACMRGAPVTIPAPWSTGKGFKGWVALEEVGLAAGVRVLIGTTSLNVWRHPLKKKSGYGANYFFLLRPWFRLMAFWIPCFERLPRSKKELGFDGESKNLTRDRPRGGGPKKKSSPLFHFFFLK